MTTVKCSKCGKDVSLQVGITGDWNKVENIVCDDCRRKMKKITVTYILYEDGFMEIYGDCDFCGCSPCAHTNNEGFDLGITLSTFLYVFPELRAEWIKRKMQP